MAFSSKLQFGDKNSDHVYNVADCHLHFMRHYNHFRPDTDARCEKVEVVVEAPGKRATCDCRSGLSITNHRMGVSSSTFRRRQQRPVVRKLSSLRVPIAIP